MTREEAIKWLEFSKDHYDGLDYGAPRIAVDMAIAALREQESLAKKQATSDWISVEERLPEDDAQVLACTKHGKAFSAHCERGRWRVSGSVKVTHWMPLPEPPKEDKHGG